MRAWAKAILLGSLFGSMGAAAQSVTFDGFADSYHAMQLQSPHDFLSSRTRLRLNLRADYEGASLFASSNAIYNAILGSSVALHEAFLSYATEHLEWKVGRQIITWGVADGLQLTDVISPMDYTEFMANDYDDIRIPVNAIRVRYNPAPLLSADFVFVPVAEFYHLPMDENNPWNRGFSSPIPLDLDDTPEKKLRNSEYGMRLSFFLPGVDVSVSALHTLHSIPVLQLQPLPDGSLELKGLYDEIVMLGADLSLPLGEFVFRAEFAEYLGESLELKTHEKVVERNTSQALLGIDWYAANDWVLMVQYLHQFIPDRDDRFVKDAHTHTMTFRISKELLRNTLKLSESATCYLNDRGIYSRSDATYALNDQIALSLGLDLFYGKEGIFDRYEENSEIYAKAKYSF